MHLMKNRDRALGAMVGLAIGDALGAPVEFRDRDTFALVTDMMPGGYFRLPAGAWTDDTAMALCLLDSLTYGRPFDPKDLLDRFLGWMERNENTSTGKCIGIGQNTFAVLGNYRRTGSTIAPKVNGRSDGNGALMRVAPVAICHWHDLPAAQEIAAVQSRTTHCSALSEQACSVMMDILCGLISGREWEQVTVGLGGAGVLPELTVILQGSWKSKERNSVRSTGYILDTLEAALWAVETTGSFEDALIAAVNLGHDADTVGAVTGQIAGGRYGFEAIPQRWLDHLIGLSDIKERIEILWQRSPISS
jgi:ADP-ribosyl-[dinitrogen reductase] hydrolase